MSKQIKNLKARITRFNKSHPSFAIDIPEMSTMRQINAATRKLEKVQQSARFQVKKDKLIRKAADAGIHISPKSIRGAKTYETAAKAVKKATKFQSDLQRHTKDIQAHNNHVYIAGKAERAYHASPTTPRQLAKSKRILNQLKKGEVEAAKKAYGVKGNETINKASRRVEKEKAKKGLRSYQGDLYVQTTMREVENSPLPELKALFTQIGYEGIIQLSAARFTVEDFAESSTEREGYDRDDILENLLDAANSLPESLRNTIERFVERHK